MAKKHFARHLVPALLAALMAAGMLSGCANEPAGTPSSAAEPSSAGTSSETSSAPAEPKAAVPFEETVEITFLGAMWSPYSADQTDITDEIQRLTNTKVTWEWSAKDTFPDKLSAVLASGNLPDVINYGTVKNIEDMLVNQGAVIALDDYLETDMPDYNSYLGEGSGPFVKFAADGKTYSVKSVIEYPSMYSYMVRTDWIKNVGKEIPTTWDGWVDLWKAFRDQDANGDGNPNNEIPFGSFSDLRSLAYACGIEKSGNYALYPDGTYGIISEHPNYELLLDTAKMLFEEKLLDPEYQTRKKDPEMFTIMDNNTCGTAYTTAERAKLSTQVNADIDPNAFWQCIVPIQGPNGDQLLGARPKYSAGGCITIGAEKSGKAQQVAQWMNWFYSEEGTKLMNYGIEGVHHEMVDGKPLLKSPYIDGFVEARQAGLISQVLPLNWLPENYEMILLQGKSYEELDPAGQTFVDGLTINSDYYYAVPPTFSTPTVVEKGVDLFDQLDIIRDSYITGQITKEDYNKRYADLKAAGLDQINTEVAEAYNTLK